MQQLRPVPGALTDTLTLSHQLLELSKHLMQASDSAIRLYTATDPAPALATNARGHLVAFFMKTASIAFGFNPGALAGFDVSAHLAELEARAKAPLMFRSSSAELSRNVAQASAGYFALVDGVSAKHPDWEQIARQVYAVFTAACVLLWHSLPGDENLWDCELEARINQLLEQHMAPAVA